MKILMVIPTLNEVEIVESNLRRALCAMKQFFASDDWRLVVADNGSTDQTRDVVARMAQDEPRLALWTTEQRGKGLAIRGAWDAYDADAFAFMDADLSTDLNDLPALIAALEQADMAVGARFHPASSRSRSLKREFVSRVYVALRNLLLPLPVKDSQCGFKALKKEVWGKLRGDLTHTGWFFDTELLAFAVKRGCTIAEVPIHWAEASHGSRKSKMRIGKSARESLAYFKDLRERLQNV